MGARQIYRVDFERDDNDTWFVDAVDVPSAHSCGQTLDSARRNIREAIALILEIEDDESFDLEERIRFPNERVQAALDRALNLRAQAAAADKAADEATVDAISTLSEADPGVSIRDLSELLHLPQSRTRRLLTSNRQSG